MEAAFAWLGQLVDWIGAFFPRWKIVRATHGGVKFKRGRHVEEIKPGIIWYWPMMTEVEIIPTARDTVNLSSQTMVTADGKSILVSAMVVVEVRDAVKLLSKTHDPGGLVADVCLTAVYNVIQGMKWDDLNEQQQTGKLAKLLREQTRRQLDKYGVWVAEAMLTDFAPCRVLRLVNDN